MAAPEVPGGAVMAWRTCDKCGTRRARYYVCPGCDAPTSVFCDDCLPVEWRRWAQPYLPTKNGEIDAGNRFVSQGYLPPRL